MLLGSALAAAVAIALAFSTSGDPESGATAGESEKAAIDRVLVADLENRTGDSTLAHIGALTADWILRGLAETRLVEIVSARSWTGTPDGSDAASSDPQEAWIGPWPRTEADIAVLGRYYRSGNSLQLHARLVDTRTGTVLRVLQPLGAPLSDPMDAIERLRQQVIGRLATLADPRLSRWAERASQPPDYPAYRQFIEGIRIMTDAQDPTPGSRRERYELALEHFYAAAAADTTFTQPLIWANMAHQNLGQHEAADSLTRRLWAVRHTLPPLDRALLDAHRARLEGDLAGALNAYRRVVGIAPESEWNVNAAIWVQANHRPREAIRYLKAVDPTRGWLRNWYTYWSVLTHAYHDLGEDEKALEVARRARERFPGNPRAVQLEAAALAGLGRVEEVRKLAEELLSPSVPWDGYVGTYVTYLAAELHAHRHPGAARDILLRHLEYDREVGRDPDPYTYVSLGRFEEARELYRQRLENDPTDEQTRMLYTFCAAARGDRETAESYLDAQAAREPRFRKFGPTVSRAIVRAALGDRARALSLLQRSREQGSRVWFHYYRFSPYFRNLHGYPPFEEFMKPKG